jgi:hypothetical protein
MALHERRRCVSSEERVDAHCQSLMPPQMTECASRTDVALHQIALLDMDPRKPGGSRRDLAVYLCEEHATWELLHGWPEKS